MCTPTLSMVFDVMFKIRLFIVHAKIMHRYVSLVCTLCNTKL